MPLYVCDAVTKELHQVGLDGSSPTLLFTASIAPYYPAYDATTDKFFFSNLDLYSINPNGSDEAKIIDHVNNTGGVDIDSSAGKLYYGLPNSNEIRKCDFDGGNDEVVLSTTRKGGRIQVDIGGGKCYWATDGFGATPAYLERNTIPGGGAEETIVTEGAATIIEQFDLDLVNGKIYWTNSADDVVRRCNLDGSDKETIVTSVVQVWGCAVDGAGGKVYYSEGTPKNVKRCDLDGSNQEVIWAGSTFPAYLYVSGAGGGTTVRARWDHRIYPLGRTTRRAR